MLLQINYRKLHTIVALSLIGNIASAAGNFTSSCFSTGTEGDCSSFINAFCTTVSTVELQDSSSHCYNARAPDVGYKCDFTAYNAHGSTNAKPDTANCELVLGAIVDDCPMGGQGIVAGGAYIFTVDPNEGSCGTDSSSTCGD